MLALLVTHFTILCEVSSAILRSGRGGYMPWDVGDIGFLAPDFVVFLAAAFAMLVAFAILLVLGQWWAR